MTIGPEVWFVNVCTTLDVDSSCTVTVSVRCDVVEREAEAYAENGPQPAERSRLSSLETSSDVDDVAVRPAVWVRIFWRVEFGGSDSESGALCQNCSRSSVTVYAA